jgi:hypothetical protein
MTRRMQHDLDALNWTILFKADDAVNCTGDPGGSASRGGLSATAHAIRNRRVVCMKNYLH